MDAANGIREIQDYTRFLKQWRRAYRSMQFLWRRVNIVDPANDTRRAPRMSVVIFVVESILDFLRFSAKMKFRNVVCVITCIQAHTHTHAHTLEVVGTAARIISKGTESERTSKRIPKLFQHASGQRRCIAYDVQVVAFDGN